MAGLGVIGCAEAQGIHRRNWACAHGEDVAQDSANARRRALIGLDVGRVIVALHLEDDAITIADIDHARIFTGALDHTGPGGRQGLEPFLRGFVGTMLVPHGRENAEFREGRCAPDEVENALIFVRLEAVGSNHLFGDVGRVVGIGHDVTSARCGVWPNP